MVSNTSPHVSYLRRSSGTTQFSPGESDESHEFSVMRRQMPALEEMFCLDFYNSEDEDIYDVDTVHDDLEAYDADDESFSSLDESTDVADSDLETSTSASVAGSPALVSRTSLPGDKRQAFAGLFKMAKDRYSQQSSSASSSPCDPAGFAKLTFGFGGRHFKDEFIAVAQKVTLVATQHTALEDLAELALPPLIDVSDFASERIFFPAPPTEVAINSGKGSTTVQALFSSRKDRSGWMC